MKTLLAQTRTYPNVPPRPEPNQGQRVIIDEQAAPEPVTTPPPVIPHTVYYWLGAIILIIIAALAAVSYLRPKAKLATKSSTKPVRPD